VRRRSRTFISLPFTSLLGLRKGIREGSHGGGSWLRGCNGGEFIREEITSEEAELRGDTKELLSSVDDGWPSRVRR
jgi:hypothetical protein